MEAQYSSVGLVSETTNSSGARLYPKKSQLHSLFAKEAASIFVSAGSHLAGAAPAHAKPAFARRGHGVSAGESQTSARAFGPAHRPAAAAAASATAVAAVAAAAATRAMAEAEEAAAAARAKAAAAAAAEAAATAAAEAAKAAAEAEAEAEAAAQVTPSPPQTIGLTDALAKDDGDGVGLGLGLAHLESDSEDEHTTAPPRRLRPGQQTHSPSLISELHTCDADGCDEEEGVCFFCCDAVRVPAPLLLRRPGTRADRSDKASVRQRERAIQEEQGPGLDLSLNLRGHGPPCSDELQSSTSGTELSESAWLLPRGGDGDVGADVDGDVVAGADADSGVDVDADVDASASSSASVSTSNCSDDVRAGAAARLELEAETERVTVGSVMSWPSPPSSPAVSPGPRLSGRILVCADCEWLLDMQLSCARSSKSATPPAKVGE